MTPLRRLAAAAALPLAAGALAYENGAPPGYTGGFGEATCAACHSDHDVNESRGRLEIHGLPARYRPGERYALELELAHPALESGGFQLSLRTADGQPAGALAATSARVARSDADGAVYLQHTAAGRVTQSQGSIRWAFEWQAPDGREPLVLNVAANAANDDDSALGDRIYTLETRIAAPRGKAQPASATDCADSRSPGLFMNGSRAVVGGCRDGGS